MDKTIIKNLCSVLELSHVPVGVKFIVFKDDYDRSLLPELDRKRTVCGMVKHAYDGHAFKVKDTCFGCEYGRNALGVGEPFHHTIASGRSFDYCDLYENYMIAHKFVKTLKYCKHEVYGVEFGPLETMDDADVVIIIANARQVMRMMQGYAYKFGPAEHLSTSGNQAMCSDLISKVVENDSLNISLMCRGARTYTQCDDGEMGISLPFHMFADFVEGTIATITPVEHDPVKRRILDKLEKDDPVRDRIVIGENYSKKLAEYDTYVKKLCDR